MCQILFHIGLFVRYTPSLCLKRPPFWYTGRNSRQELRRLRDEYRSFLRLQYLLHRNGRGKIRDIIGPELVTLHNLKDDSPALMSQYDVLILGIPTWDFGEIQEDWEAVWEQLDALDLNGKIVALYGMGDQLGYGEWFLDALGMLHDKLATKGVKFVGYWPTEGYEFTSPKPVIADGQLFVGLALDETNQYDLSDERIQNWCEQILGEMAEHFA